jgi:hypothetical protein
MLNKPPVVFGTGCCHNAVSCVDSFELTEYNAVINVFLQGECWLWNAGYQSAFPIIYLNPLMQLGLKMTLFGIYFTFARMLESTPPFTLFELCFFSLKDNIHGHLPEKNFY